jgi:type IV pilus assembly protein PilV
MLLNTASSRQRSAGFGLIEVMVSLIVIAVGLLGIAKMEALAYASTGVASARSLAAIEAESLSAVMHADRAYWASGAANGSFTVSPTAISNVTATTLLNTAVTCTTTSTTPAQCTPPLLAAWDVQQWQAALTNVIPNYLATVTCTTPVTVSVNCTIQITWSENNVAINTQGQGTIGSGPSYTLYVQP